MTSLENVPVHRLSSLVLGLPVALCSPCLSRSFLLLREGAGSRSPKPILVSLSRHVSPTLSVAGLSGAGLAFSLASCRAAPRRQHRRARWRRHSGLAASSMHGIRLRVGIGALSSSSIQHFLPVRLNVVRAAVTFYSQRRCSGARLARGTSREACSAVARRERGWGNLAAGGSFRVSATRRVSGGGC